MGGGFEAAPTVLKCRSVKWLQEADFESTGRSIPPFQILLFGLTRFKNLHTSMSLNFDQGWFTYSLNLCILCLNLAFGENAHALGSRNVNKQNQNNNRAIFRKCGRSQCDESQRLWTASIWSASDAGNPYRCPQTGNSYLPAGKDCFSTDSCHSFLNHWD